MFILTAMDTMCFPFSPGSREGPPDQTWRYIWGYSLSRGAPGRKRRKPESRGEGEPPEGANKNEGAVQCPYRFSKHITVGGAHGHRHHCAAKHSKGKRKRVVENKYVAQKLLYITYSIFHTHPYSSFSQAKAEEELQETKGQIDSLLSELSSLNQPGARAVGSGVSIDVTDAPFSQPEGAVMSHTEMLQVGNAYLCSAGLDIFLSLASWWCTICDHSQAELQQLQAQQAQMLQITQSTRSLLDQPDSTVPPEEKRRLRAALDQLQAQHQDRLQSCQVRKKNNVLWSKWSKLCDSKSFSS